MIVHRVLAEAAIRLYDLLILLFPMEFRAVFGEEMRAAFKEGCGSSLARKGLSGFVAFVARAVADVLVEGPREQLAMRLSGSGKNGLGFWARSSEVGRRRLEAGRPKTGTSENGMYGIMHDLRFAIRGFIRRPAFTGVSLLTLTLGIGSATSIYSVVNGVLLKPFPYPEEEELVVLWNTDPGRGQ
jgi:hypothetical protein